MKYTLVLALLSLISFETKSQVSTEVKVNKNIENSPTVFTLFHYNIKELDTVKVDQGAKEQLLAVKKIIDQYPIDILSINEIQYDLPNVPNSSHQSKGENMAKLRDILDRPELAYEAFGMANTGKNARTRADGTYYENASTPQARASADQVNFGVMPAQYSTGAIFRYPKMEEQIFTDIKWKDFNPNIDLSKYKTAGGKALPADMQLFDKNFTDVAMDIKGKPLHLILLHTVPAFHFGNMKSPNYVRNRDQLRFLEWYLTGQTDIKVNLKNVEPLEPGSSFVAVGDWNVDYLSTENPGGAVLRSLFKKTNIWTEDLTFTNEGSVYFEESSRHMLDYMVTSSNIEPLQGMIIHPDFNRIDAKVCRTNPGIAKAGYTIVKSKATGRTCYTYVKNEYVEFKKASDHFPIYGKFKIN